MRENRPSGSEGGGREINRVLLPLIFDVRLRCVTQLLLRQAPAKRARTLITPKELGPRWRVGLVCERCTVAVIFRRTRAPGWDADS